MDHARSNGLNVLLVCEPVHKYLLIREGGGHNMSASHVPMGRTFTGNLPAKGDSAARLRRHSTDDVDAAQQNKNAMARPHSFAHNLCVLGDGEADGPDASPGSFANF